MLSEGVDSRQRLKARESNERRRTWLVQTLLNVTKAKVCASIVEARSFFARRNGSTIAERKSCGTKASDSSLKGTAGEADLALESEEERYRSVL